MPFFKKKFILSFYEEVYNLQSNEPMQGMDSQPLYVDTVNDLTYKCTTWPYALVELEFWANCLEIFKNIHQFSTTLPNLTYIYKLSPSFIKKKY